MSFIYNVLFPDPPRVIPQARVWNIAMRTAHIAVTGILLGGHVFDVAEERLRVFLYWCLGTGAALLFIEAYPHGRWLYQGRGLMVMLKLALLAVIPFMWDWRVPLLLVVVVLASVGSHMSSRFRYYSFVHGKVVQTKKDSSCAISVPSFSGTGARGD